MRIIDNKNGKTLGREIINGINHNSVLSISTGYFTIYALHLLKDKFQDIKGLEFLLLSNSESRVPEGITIDVESIIWGTDEEKELKRQLVLRRVTQECAKFISQKVNVLQTVTPNSLGFKLIFTTNNTEESSSVVNCGMADFNASSLGHTSVHSPQHYLIQTEKDAVEQLYSMYSQIAHSKVASHNITESILLELQKGYKDYTPDFVYYFILHHLFHYSIVEFADDKIIKTKTGFKDKDIWKKLYKFQKDGVIGSIEKIEKFGGCIIADSVGLGKTFEALAVIKYYELRGDRVLVLCPKKLRDNWLIYTQADKRNLFLNDRFNYKVLNHTDLTRKRGKSGDIDLATFIWSCYDLVVIDESHNFRNNNPAKGEMTRYARLMNEVIKKGVDTKLLMLSATPVNNRMNDLKNQISFITKGENTIYKNKGVDNISNVMKLAQRQFTEWNKSNKRDINTLFDTLDNRYFKLLDMLTIARSRKHITKYYNSNDVGKFPKRLIPINRKTDIDSQRLFPSLRDINNAIRKMNLANFKPISYLKEDMKPIYADKYDYVLSSGSVFTQVDREESLIHLMRVNYLKRMESSIHSFYLSIESLLAQVNDKLYKIEHFDEYATEGITIEDVDIEDNDSGNLVGNKVKVLLQDIKLLEWKQDLEYDKTTLERLLASAKTVTAMRDEKLEELKRMIVDKLHHPINEGNKKVIIFTAFADTAAYLYKYISDWALSEYGLYSALIKGSGTNKTNFLKCGSKEMNDMLTNFSPRSKERDKVYPDIVGEIDILIATDCISEGQNLQDCDYLVNYDIHWNPVRIIQRFGRIDRLGSVNDAIQLVNFWPNMELNEYINLESRVKGKMVLLDISATGEENLIEMNKNDEMIDLEYRRKQLEQIQNTVLDLEDMQGGVTITDTNMNDFRMDLLGYESSHIKELQSTPKGIHTVVQTSSDEIVPGTVFCIRSSAEQKGNSLLAPYYLVYIGEDGNTVLGYTQGKRCLDYLKKLCQGKTDVLVDMAEQLKNETKNYANMRKYSSQLQLAIESVIGKSHEVGAASFFGSDLISLDSEGVNSQSDFDIVAFVVVKR